MTKEEAIKVLKRLLPVNHIDDVRTAIDLAIESLSADTVSRTQYQGLLNAIGKVYVEVVQCKDCRHYEDGMIGNCWKMDRGVSEDFYCAYGERGAENENNKRDPEY